MNLDKILYFPTITIPKTPWLFKSLLYWDTVETITPKPFFRNPDLFEGDYMRELLQTGLVEQISPMLYTYDIPDFKENFLNYVDNAYADKKENYKRKDGNLVHVSKIHLEKMHEIGNSLVERELAFYRDGWYYIHQSIANDFMFYLATVIGKVKGSQPMTDRMASIKTRITVDTESQGRFINRNGLRKIILNNVFPTPMEITKFGDLYDFKSKHEKQLKDFRKYIERELLNIDSAPKDMHDERLQFLINEIEEEKCSIAEKMRDKWKVFDYITFGSLSASAFGFANAIQNSGEIGITSGTLSLAVAVLNTIKNTNKYQKDILSAPLAYAYLTERKWAQKSERDEQFMEAIQ